MPISDDHSVQDHEIALRILHEDWVTAKGGTVRPASFSLMDSNNENSCFLSNPTSLAELQRLFPGLAVACIPVGVLRANGYGVERRPAECPLGYLGDPNDHVVVGPTEIRTRNEIQRSAKAIVSNLELVMLRMLPNK